MFIKNVINQHIYSLIKVRFNPIDKLSCQPFGCQATPRALEDMEYIRIPSWNLVIIIYYVHIIPIHPRLMIDLECG